MELRLNASSGSYDIIIEKGSITSKEGINRYLVDYLRGRAVKKVYIVSDINVDKIYSDLLVAILEGNDYEVYKRVVAPGEVSKHISNLESIYEDLVAKSITRSDTIIALGGGVVGDLAGFVAATYLRGVDYIQVPTSLLAQVDSSVGGKTAVNIGSGKNLVGAFYQPSLVIIDTNVLKTLSVDQFRSGMAEVIKYGMIADSDLFDLLEDIRNDYMDDTIFNKIDEIVYRSCSIKKSVVEEDEFDRGRRMILNFGHTIGHGIEAYYNYQEYGHGQAVAMGMYEITRIAYENGLVDYEILDRLGSVLEGYVLRKDSPVDIGNLIEYIARDKKVLDGSLNIVLVDKIGQAVIKRARIEKDRIIL